VVHYTTIHVRDSLNGITRGTLHDNSRGIDLANPNWNALANRSEMKLMYIPRFKLQMFCLTT